jgi:hypothetical protein
MRRVQGDDRNSAAMKAMGYMNCLLDKSPEGVGRYLHRDTVACELAVVREK